VSPEVATLLLDGSAVVELALDEVAPVVELALDGEALALAADVADVSSVVDVLVVAASAVECEAC